MPEFSPIKTLALFPKKIGYFDESWASQGCERFLSTIDKRLYSETTAIIEPAMEKQKETDDFEKREDTLIQQSY